MLSAVVKMPSVVQAVLPSTTPSDSTTLLTLIGFVKALMFAQPLVVSVHSFSPMSANVKTDHVAQHSKQNRPGHAEGYH